MPTTLEQPAVPVLANFGEAAMEALETFAETTRKRMTMVIILGLTALACAGTFGYLIFREEGGHM